MEEKIVLVTGANKGIGFGIAKHLGLNGWKVVVGARNQQRAEKAISELEATGVQVLGWTNIELDNLSSLEQAAKEVNENQGTATATRTKQRKNRQHHRSIGNKSVLASAGLCNQQSRTKCHDGRDGNRVRAERHAAGNFLSTPGTYHHRSEREHGPSGIPRHRDGGKKNCRTDQRRAQPPG